MSEAEISNTQHPWLCPPIQTLHKSSVSSWETGCMCRVHFNSSLRESHMSPGRLPTLDWWGARALPLLSGYFSLTSSQERKHSLILVFQCSKPRAEIFAVYTCFYVIVHIVKPTHHESVILSSWFTGNFSRKY